MKNDRHCPETPRLPIRQMCLMFVAIAPMAIPSFGGMLVVLISIFVVPVLYAWAQEIRLKA